MADEEPFRIPLPVPLKGRRVTSDELESILLGQLKKSERDYENALWQLARFYSETDRHSLAVTHIQKLLARAENPEDLAARLLNLGQLMEQIENYESAIAYYSQGLTLNPNATSTSYFLNNNLCYCLNHFGRYSEAEPYCRAAVALDRGRHNAYKNLGISLAGQGHYAEAARNYIKATKANAGDSRALTLLEKLLTEHSELSIEIPDIDEQLAQCREAVQMANDLRRKAMRSK